MKKTFFFLLILLFGICLSCMPAKKSFEGSIEYKITVTVINAKKVTQAELIKDYGTKTTGYHKAGKFKDFGNAENKPIQLYLPKTKRLYSFGLSKTDTIDSYPITGYKAEYDYQLQQNVDTILGYPCHVLLAKNEYVEKQYYFSPKLYLNPKYYQGYTMGNKSEIMEKIQAVTLKVIIKNSVMKLESIATNISIGPVNDSIFELPKGRAINEIK